MLAVKTSKSNLTIFRRAAWLMGNQFEISIVGGDVMWAEERIKNAVAEITRVEKLLSTFSDGSKVNEINRNAGIKPVKVDTEIFRLIERSLAISTLTYGAFDITYFTADHQSAAEKISPYINGYSNYQNVITDSQAMSVFLKDKGMRISFAASSKGYAADRARHILQMQGVSSGVINAGGDLLTWGAQPDGKPWTISTADPEKQTHPFAHLDISNMCMASAVNTEKYTSIYKYQDASINSKKGFPVSKIVSVSILSPTAELSDALSTPILNIGVNAGLYLINQLNQIACIIIDDQERVYTSKGIVQQ